MLTAPLLVITLSRLIPNPVSVQFMVSESLNELRIGKHSRAPQEHLPPTTGRDVPPAGGVAPGTRTGGPVTSEFDIKPLRDPSELN